jgi:hypothetical protein
MGIKTKKTRNKKIPRDFSCKVEGLVGLVVCDISSFKTDSLKIAKKTSQKSKIPKNKIIKLGEKNGK